MPFETSGPEAYLAASRHLIDHCDLLLAVWDGAPATGSGGTAEAVDYAREHGVAVTVAWPSSARRKH
jgi:alpha-D-ribose 1-methylphosphonate 5-triphosphate synthase subunit PhnL